jgi:hypothetical protein
MPSPVRRGLGWVSLTPALKYQRGVNPAEGEVVTHYVFGIDSTRFTHDVIKLGAFTVNIDEVGGGVSPLLVHHLNAGPSFQRATGTQRMPRKTFETADGRAVAK